MKRLCAFLLVMLLLCGCSATEEIKGDDSDFLTQGDWTGNDLYCINVISFGEDGSFSNWCTCGNPVGDSDLSEEFGYRADDRTILLLDSEGEVMETGKVLYIDEQYLVIDLWDSTYTYENLNAYRPTIRACALEYTGTDELTKPCLTVLGYENDVLTVSAYNYDADAADNYEVWNLPVSENITFTTVSVTVDNGEEWMETGMLSKHDYADVGEFYHTGYLEFNQQGQVVSVVFYGELIIQG